MDERIGEYAKKVIYLAKDTIAVRYRFFDRALSKLNIEAAGGLKGYLSRLNTLYYDPEKLLVDYMKEPAYAVRLCLHVMFHIIFLHALSRENRDEELWNLACDIAVENVSLSLNIQGSELSDDDEKRIVLSRIGKWVPDLTAPRIYREFAAQGISNDAKARYKRLFSFDAHDDLKNEDPDEIIMTEEEFKKVAERIKAEIKSFSRDGEGNEEILKNLREATRIKQDYEKLLRRFAVEGELIKVNPDEFDQVFYTYGLSLYKNMPLIEPLEYAEDKRVKDFVIAIDTSASCRGELVKQFLKRTVSVLYTENTFFDEVNIHIVQCDSEIKKVVKIKGKEDIEEFIENFELSGMGATDFRPVFDYVEDKISKKEFDNLRGIIYFTDGYGIYPTSIPSFDTVFVFAGEDEYRPKIPKWATKCVLENDI